MNRIIRVVCVFLLGFSSLAVAQNLGTGLYAFGSFDSRGFDSINIGNLNTHFEIPIVNKQGRGLPFSYSLVYEGLIWSSTGSVGNNVWQADGTWGFRGELLGGVTGYVSYSQITVSCPRPSGYSGPVPNGVEDYGYVYHDAYGKNHGFKYTFQLCPLTPPATITGNGSSSDGSGLSYGVSDGRVHTRNGSVINAPTGVTSGGIGSITDTNGNEITTTGNGVFTDTLGVPELTVAGSGTPTSPLTLTYPVTLQANSATSASAVITYRSYTVQTNFQCPGITEYGATATNLVDHVTLADGSTYSFTYEPTTPGVSGPVTGRLASITLPAGGTINYSYSGGCGSAGGTGINADGTTGGLTRATTDGTKTYTRTTVNANATNTTVHDEKGNQALYQFTISNSLYYETHRQIYQGGIGGTPLLNQTTCYNGATTSCDGAEVAGQITQLATTLQFNGGTSLTTDNVYDLSGMLTSSTQMNGSTTLQTTANTYTPAEYLSGSKVTDGSGNILSFTTYGYDETTPTATSGIPQHVAAPGTRGNQTSAHVQLATGVINTTTTYYDTGVPVAVTNPNGTTSYGYDSTQTFAIATTLPTPSSGVTLATTASYDPQSGVQRSATGLNAGQTVQFTQYDGLLRPSAASLPNGGQVTASYSPTQIGTFQTMSSSETAQTYTLLDGYGRTSRVAVYNGQSSNPWYQVDYCYDATGLLQFQTVRYQSTGFIAPKQCSGNGTTYAYDALGRVTSSTNADGTTSTVYTGRAVQTTDVNGVTKVTQYDMLGRIFAVCEISPHSFEGDSPGPCLGMDIAGNGYQTNYAYTGLTTTVTQGAQQRTFTTDQAGRTTSVMEPERGVTTYSYMYIPGTGLQVTRTRPRANPGNAGLLTTTTTQYDSLGRPVTVTYNDGITANKSFWYDQNPFLSWSSQTTTNLKGNLGVTATGLSVLLTSDLFSYDALGHVTNVWQCAPSICNTSSQASRSSINLTYDLAGNLTAEGDGASGTIAYGRSPA
jgi:YD repeat-containing protein